MDHTSKYKGKALKGGIAKCNPSLARFAIKDVGVMYEIWIESEDQTAAIYWHWHPDFVGYLW